MVSVSEEVDGAGLKLTLVGVERGHQRCEAEAGTAGVNGNTWLLLMDHSSRAVLDHLFIFIALSSREVQQLLFENGRLGYETRKGH